MTNYRYRSCVTCGVPLDVERGDDNQCHGTGWELALQEFDEEGTIGTHGAKHDGYLCDACATTMWTMFLAHVTREGEHTQ